MSAVDELTASPGGVRLPARPRAGVIPGWIRARPAASTAIAVLFLSWAALIAVHHAPSPAIPRARAISIVERSPLTSRMLAGVHWNRAQVLAIDSTHDSVWFFDGPRLRVAAIVAQPGVVQYDSDAAERSVAYGSPIANDPLVLGLLSVAFVLMTAVWPLWRLRNLDVLALTLSTASIVLLNGALLGRMVVFGSAVLLYLGLRCAWVAFGPGPPNAPSISLFERVTAGWEHRQRVRLLRLLALACGLVLAMVGISSTGAVDVAWAVMEGATNILRGVLPYGHIPGVLHGDTYPIGSYALYTPVAWLWPVHDTWDSADPALYVAVAGALGGAAAIWRSSRGAAVADRLGAAEVRTLRMAIAWLTFPALVVTVSTGSTDAVLAVILLALILLWRRPAAAGAMVAVGAWFKLVPLALAPLLLGSLRGRRMAAALAAVAVVTIAAFVLLVALGGLSALGVMGHAVGYQADRVSPQSVWALTGSVPLQQLIQAATLAMIAGASVRLRRDGALASDRTRLAALCAAVMIAVQLSASYWTYMYLVWALPGVMLSLLWRADEGIPAGEPA